jgi:hypothetical protein
MERLKGAIGFGDPERGVVEQHHPARADADIAGVSGGAADQDFGNRGGDGGHAVVFGIPEPRVAESVGLLGEQHGFVHRLDGAGALGDGREVLERQVERGGHGQLGWFGQALLYR